MRMECTRFEIDCAVLDVEEPVMLIESLFLDRDTRRMLDQTYHRGKTGPRFALSHPSSWGKGWSAFVAFGEGGFGFIADGSHCFPGRLHDGAIGFGNPPCAIKGIPTFSCRVPEGVLVSVEEAFCVAEICEGSDSRRSVVCRRFRQGGRVFHITAPSFTIG